MDVSSIFTYVYAYEGISCFSLITNTVSKSKCFLKKHCEPALLVSVEGHVEMLHQGILL